MAEEWFINLNAVKRVYQNVVTEDEEGEEMVVKMQCTPEFREAFNDFVFNVLSDCISRSILDGRKTLWPEDLTQSNSQEEQLDQA
jgi:histone H3/H4